MDNLAQLLKESWTLVEDRRDRVAGYFYARMFLSDPDLRTLFPVQMTGQRDRLLEAIVTAVQTIGDPERFDEYLRSLGRDHRKYHVRPAHYEVMGSALLAALREVAGERWTVEHDQAWRDAYRVIAERMQAGAADDPNPPFWHAEVVGHERRGSDIAVLTCRPLQQQLPYRAGQYVSVEVPRYQPRLWRTYSIANAPRADGTIELHVRAVGAGWVSSALVRRTRVGDLLRVAAPMGAMTLDRDSSRDVLCVAGGVGLAPVKALAEELAGYNRTRWMHVFVGAAGREDLYGLTELYDLAARHPWLSVTPACSADPGFAGERGEITDIFARYGPWTAHDCYVSGSARLVRSALRTLAADDVPPENIRYDAFGDI
ncbi:globin domain-containing protein [Micromonospora sp. WMMD1102]|uniref:globin domain-containing protein n=1 Tax=Micromonospora sp. WMMD1102 TaxID=3016105 RepID=UPI00241590E5|nr:globin domain-containing protein [Micromonospora sp. WMMD1102]MDG4791107.1 globin domain-containing protein [Micromonospora sp. WMMD1102]